MKSRLPSMRTVALLLLLIFLPLLILTDAQIAADGVRSGLALCTQVLLPSLFPFLVLSELLIVLHAAELPGKWLKKPFHALFGLSEGGTTALLLGVLCGFPVGATAAASLCDRGDISRAELHRLLLFSNNPSAGFLIGTVGCVLFGNRSVGIALFVIIWISAALVGISLRLLCKMPESFCNIPPNGVKNIPFVTAVTGSISKGISTMLHVCSFVLFFSCISACLSHVLLPVTPFEAVRVLLCGLVEMTAGVHAATQVLPPASALRMVAFISGFSGLSVCLQLFSVSERHAPRILPYFLAKLIQAFLCLALTEAYLRLFRPSLRVADCITAFSPLPLQQKSALALLLPFVLLLLAHLCRQTRYPRQG